MCVVNKTFTRSTTAASTHSIYSHSNTAVWINPPTHNIIIPFPVAPMSLQAAPT